MSKGVNNIQNNGGKGGTTPKQRAGEGLHTMEPCLSVMDLLWKTTKEGRGEGAAMCGFYENNLKADFYAEKP